MESQSLFAHPHISPLVFVWMSSCTFCECTVSVANSIQQAMHMDMLCGKIMHYGKSVLRLTKNENY